MSGRYECDCGVVYPHVDLLQVCAERGHGARQPFAIEERLDRVVAALLELEGTQAWGPALERALAIARGAA